MKRRITIGLAVLAGALAVGAACFFLYRAQLPEEGVVEGRTQGMLAHYDRVELVGASELIASGTVTSVAGSAETTQGRIYTEWMFAPGTVYKGACDAPVRLRAYTGDVGNARLEDDSEPGYQVGEEYLLFLERDTVGGKATTDAYYTVVGGPQGQFVRAQDGVYTNENPGVDAADPDTLSRVDVRGLAQQIPQDMAAYEARRAGQPSYEEAQAINLAEMGVSKSQVH